MGKQYLKNVRCDFIKCPSCGEENKEGSKFCKHCGATLQTNVQTPASPQPKDNKNTIIICATAIICVIIIAAAFVFLSGNNNDSSDALTI